MASPSDYSDSDLKQIIENYREQVEVVNIVEKKIRELQSKKKTKKEEEQLNELKTQLPNDIEDLKTWKQDAEEAQKILMKRQEKPAKPSPLINRDRKLYISLVRRWLGKALSAEELKTVESLLNACTSKEKMKRIYNSYRDIALAKVPSTQAMTAEELDQRENPLSDVVPVIQAFARSKLSQNISHSKQPLVQPKPPKRVSRPPEEPISTQTQTSQTQTLVPLNAFKFIEKGENRFLEPMTPEKAEELAMKKKSIKSVTILNGNRFKRKPYIIYSRAH